ncbi:hypothetical protein [Rhodoblastus sp.]|uniref:hypothetical protein n=1 Tax=Rhodoblastus sp. TaxID=1962975 RepID=UPI003F9AF3C2
MSDALLDALQAQIDDMSFLLAELKREMQLASGLPGAVKSYDPSSHTAVIDVGYATQSLPVGDDEGNVSPLRVGQLVHVYCPGASLANAFVQPAGYSGSAAPPVTDGSKVFSLPNGGQFRSQSGNIAHIVAGAVTQLILELGGQKYTINPNALLPA